MQRSNWNFEYDAPKLSEAAGRQLAFHTERLDFWLKKRQDVMTKIRSEGGIDVDERIVLGYRSPKASDWERGAKVMVRNDLQDDLEECLSKLHHHTQLKSEYEGWLRALDANPQASFKLDIEDWVYFFGAK
ncbi:MAG: hypothetical protein U1E89_21490 [Burkholderiaceae bacterium]